MKTHRLKNYLKLGILLFGISLLTTNCESDLEFQSLEQEEQQSRFTVKSLDHEQVKSNPILAEELKKVGHSLLKGSKSGVMERSVYDQQHGIEIYTDNANYIEDNSNGNHSYSFLISRNGNTSGNLENLLLHANTLGGYDAYIVSFGFSAEEYSQLTEQQVNGLSTSLTPIDMDTSLVLDNSLSRTYGCSETWEYISYTDHNGDLHGVSSMGTCLVGGCKFGTSEWVMTSMDCGWFGDGGGSGDGDPPPVDTGGSGSNNNGDNENGEGNDDGNDGSDGNETFPILVVPNTRNPHIRKLNELSQNTKIKTEIARLLGMVNSSIDEDGKQFDRIPNSEPIDYNIVNPLLDQSGTNHIKFPDIRSNTSVNIHLHPKWGFISGESQLRRLSPILSDDDLAYTLQLFDESDEDNDITSILVSTEGVFALRATDAERAEFMNNKLDQKRFWRRYLDDFYDEVLATEEGQPPYTDEQLVENFVAFLTTYKINNNDEGQGFGLSIYQATLDSNGNITGWTQLQNN